MIARRYLDLLEGCLTGTLYRDPPQDPWAGVVRDETGKQVKIGEAAGPLTVDIGPYDPAKRFFGRDWPATALTMIGHVRLRNIRECAKTIFEAEIPGDFLEAGVWRGGACIYMRAILEAFYEADTRKIWVADSFEGLPPPELPADKNDLHHIMRQLSVSLEEVKANFSMFDLLDDRVVFMKGWFKDTLPKAPIGQLALLRIDGDMYGSTMEVLNALYEKVSPGGFIIVDDYGIVPGCKTAVDEFHEVHGIKDPMTVLEDRAGAYWRKS